MLRQPSTLAPSAHPRGAFLSFRNEVSYTIKKSHAHLAMYMGRFSAVPPIFADLQQQSAALLMITESPCPIKDRSEMVFIRDLCQNASSTALQCRYRRFSLIQIPGLLFSSTRCLFIKFCPYLNRSVSICKEPLIIYFCRSTFCTSCRCRRDRDHWDKSLLPLRWW